MLSFDVAYLQWTARCLAHSGSKSKMSLPDQLHALLIQDLRRLSILSTFFETHRKQSSAVASAAVIYDQVLIRRFLGKVVSFRASSQALHRLTFNTDQQQINSLLWNQRLSLKFCLCFSSSPTKSCSVESYRHQELLEKLLIPKKLVSSNLVLKTAGS